jgi:hypothetical protein
MKTLPNNRWTITFLTIWLTTCLILRLTWEMSGREFYWWTTAIYTVVIAAADVLSVRIFLSMQRKGIDSRKLDQPLSRFDI